MAGVKGRSGGHNAKTVQEHKLAGTYQKVRHDGISNPEPPPGIPIPPKALKGDAKREWSRMLVWLEESRTLSTVDASALYQYCQLFARVERLVTQQLAAAKRMKTYEARLDEIPSDQLHESYALLNQMAKQEASYGPQIRMGQMALLRYLTEFGLTPASRGRVKVAGEQEKANDPWSDLDDEDDTVN